MNSKIVVSLVILLFLSLFCKSQSVDSLKQSLRTSDGKGIRTKSEIDKFLQLQTDSLGIIGLAVALIEDEKVVYYRTFGLRNKEKAEKVDDATLFEAASMTKPVFAYTVLQLAKKGVLNLDTPLYRYYYYKDIAHDNRYKLITARMVLNHTSGLPNWRHEKFRELTIDAAPGSKFEYSGEAYGYLGLVVEQLTGKSLQLVMQEEVFIPLNMRNSFMVLSDSLVSRKAMGYEKGLPTQVFMPLRAHPAGTLHTTVLDYSKFLIELMKEERQANSIFRQMALPQIEGKAPKVGDPNSGMWVGSGIFIERTHYGIKYQHGGNNGDFMGNFVFFKDQHKGYVFFMNCDKMPQFLPAFDHFLDESPANK